MKHDKELHEEIQGIFRNGVVKFSNNHAEDLRSDFEKSRESEKVCDYCGDYMEKVKIRKKNHYSKRNNYYKCSCGHQFRERTTNEILRDIGKRDD